jgi:hypothetical protein
MQQLTERFAIPVPIVGIIFQYTCENGKEYRVENVNEVFNSDDDEDCGGELEQTTLATQLCSDEKEQVFLERMLKVCVKDFTCNGCFRISFKNPLDKRFGVCNKCWAKGPRGEGEENLEWKGYRRHRVDGGGYFAFRPFYSCYYCDKPHKSIDTMMLERDDDDYGNNYRKDGKYICETNCTSFRCAGCFSHLNLNTSSCVSLCPRRFKCSNCVGEIDFDIIENGSYFRRILSKGEGPRRQKDMFSLKEEDTTPYEPDSYFASMFE